MISKTKEAEIFASTCCPVECCVEKALNVIGGKYSFLVIKQLFSGTKRFGQLRKLLHDLSPRTLTSCLRSLEENGIVDREVFATVPATVEYSLTDKGRDLKGIIQEMYLWGEKWT